MTHKKTFKYTGDLVLGMHDALVELSGIIAGTTLAISNSKIIILSTSIAAVVASLSMAAANYQAHRSEEKNDALIAATYTGIMYVTTSALLIFPFTIIPNKYWALIMMCIIAVLIIFVFNCVIGIISKRPFIKRFFEMLFICAGVATTAFLIGHLTKHWLGINI